MSGLSNGSGNNELKQGIEYGNAAAAAAAAYMITESTTNLAYLCRRFGPPLREGPRGERSFPFNLAFFPLIPLGEITGNFVNSIMKFLPFLRRFLEFLSVMLLHQTNFVPCWRRYGLLLITGEEMLKASLSLSLSVALTAFSPSMIQCSKLHTFHLGRRTCVCVWRHMLEGDFFIPPPPLGAGHGTAVEKENNPESANVTFA